MKLINLDSNNLVSDIMADRLFNFIRGKIENRVWDQILTEVVLRVEERVWEQVKIQVDNQFRGLWYEVK
jgi:hypothetical protein